MTVADTTRLMRGCRQNKVSLGTAVAVLTQLATAKVLHRRYQRGEISDEEWGYIRKQPTHSRGPLNIRPHLDKDWYKNGGDGEIMLVLVYFHCTLPTFPSPPGFSKTSVYETPDGAPSYSQLLSQKRFVYRCNIIRQQLKEQIAHPLFADLAEFQHRDFLSRKKTIYQHWHSSHNGQTSQNGMHLNGLRKGLAFTYEWTTLGDVSCYAVP